MVQRPESGRAHKEKRVGGQEAVKCSNCGFRIDKSASFCGKCGFPVMRYKKRRKYIPITICFCLFLGICISFILYIHGRNKIVGYYENLNNDFMEVKTDGSFRLYSASSIVNGTYKRSGIGKWIFITANGFRSIVTSDSLKYGIFVKNNELELYYGDDGDDSEVWLYYPLDQKDYNNDLNLMLNGTYDTEKVNEKAWERIKKNRSFAYKSYDGIYCQVDFDGNEISDPLKYVVQNADKNGFDFSFYNKETGKYEKHRMIYNAQSMWFYPNGEVQRIGAMDGPLSEHDVEVCFDLYEKDQMYIYYTNDWARAKHIE